MQKLKGCAFKIGIFFVIGGLCCLLLHLAGIGLGTYFLQFFLFLGLLAAIVTAIGFAIFIIIFGIVDHFQSGNAKTWWDAAKEGKTIEEKQSETRRKK